MARTNYRSTILRPAGGRPQLKRDPLGGDAHVPTTIIRYLSYPIGKRVRTGLVGGVVFAALFSGLATIGRISMGAARYEVANGPWLPTVAIYFGVLPLAGAIVGALLRLYRFAWGAIMLGFIVVFPLILAFGRLGSMEGMPLGAQVVGSAVLALVVGGGVALQSWSVDRKRNHW